VEHPDPLSPVDPMSAVDPAELTAGQRHALLSRLLLPQSIAMISTLDAAGDPLVAPLGYCVPVRGQEALVAVTIAAVRDAGGEPELVRSAALASGALVANLTTADLAAHLVELGRAERDRSTGLPRWTTVPSRRVAVPGLAGARARLECRVREQRVPDQEGRIPGGELAVRSGPPPGQGYVLFVEVVCVVADPELLGPVAPIPPAPRAEPGRAEFPWFFGPADGSVVGRTEPAGGGRRAAAPLVIDQPPAS
jgi:flavin reductase (DIM6/NTAB) family NADH-FMN oxidoreductase RutF